MSTHEQSSELAAVVATLQAEVKALRAESSAAHAVRRRSRLRVLVPILSLLCIMSLSLALMPTTRAQTPADAADAEKAQPSTQQPATSAETPKGASLNATGGPLVIGQSNAPSNVGDSTILVPPGSTQLMPSALRINNYSDTDIAGPLRTGRSIAILGSTSGVDPQNTAHVGVMGLSDKSEGVYGYSSGSTGTGVYGQATGGSGYGVRGEALAAIGDGVSGRGGRYGGVFRGDRAPIFLAPNSTAGAPSTGQHFRGELVVSADGHLWFCRTDGTPGEWVRLDLSSTFVPLVQK